MSKGPWTEATRARRAHRVYVPPTYYPTPSDYRTAFSYRTAYIEAHGMWPERRHDHPETLEQTLRRIK